MVFCVILGIILNSFFESQTFSPSTHEEWQLGCRLLFSFFFFFPLLRVWIENLLR